MLISNSPSSSESACSGQCGPSRSHGICQRSVCSGNRDVRGWVGRADGVADWGAVRSPRLYIDCDGVVLARTVGARSLSGVSVAVALECLPRAAG